MNTLRLSPDDYGRGPDYDAPAVRKTANEARVSGGKRYAIERSEADDPAKVAWLLELQRRREAARK